MSDFPFTVTQMASFANHVHITGRSICMVLWATTMTPLQTHHQDLLSIELYHTDSLIPGAADLQCPECSVRPFLQFRGVSSATAFGSRNFPSRSNGKSLVKVFGTHGENSWPNALD